MNVVIAIILLISILFFLTQDDPRIIVTERDVKTRIPESIVSKPINKTNVNWSYPKSADTFYGSSRGGGGITSMPDIYVSPTSQSPVSPARPVVTKAPKISDKEAEKIWTSTFGPGSQFSGAHMEYKFGEKTRILDSKTNTLKIIEPVISYKLVDDVNPKYNEWMNMKPADRVNINLRRWGEN